MQCYRLYSQLLFLFYCIYSYSYYFSFCSQLIISYTLFKLSVVYVYMFVLYLICMHVASQLDVVLRRGRTVACSQPMATVWKLAKSQLAKSVQLRMHGRARCSQLAKYYNYIAIQLAGYSYILSYYYNNCKTLQRVQLSAAS